jgi:hypothetical protein
MMMLALGFTACSDETSNPYAKESSISIVSSDIEFSALPATGQITVSAPNGISKVETQSDWVTTSVSGNTVTVNVTANESLEGRSARLAIYSGTDHADVVVQQLGIDVAIIGSPEVKVERGAQEYRVQLRHNVPVEFGETPDWLTATLDGDQLILNFTKNTGDEPRTCNLTYHVGNLMESYITVTQNSKESLTGDYLFEYQTSGTVGATKYQAEATITKGEEGYKLNLKTNEAKDYFIPLTVTNTEDGYIVNISSASYMGGKYTLEGTDYDVVALVMGYKSSPNSVTRTYDSAVSIQAETEELKGEEYRFKYAFGDNKCWPNYTIHGLRIALFSATPYGSKTYNSTFLATYYYPTLYKK